MFDSIEPVEVVVYGAAYHTDRSVPHNEFNPGLGLRFKQKDQDFFYAVGNYQNSNWKDSTYFAVGKEFWNMGPVSVRGLVGLITGYNKTVLPVVLPEVVLQLGGGYGLGVNFIPPTPWTSGVFGFSLTKSF